MAYYYTVYRSIHSYNDEIKVAMRGQACEIGHNK